MTSRDFCFWLQGAIEFGLLEKEDPRDEGIFLESEKIDLIKKHLNLVFKHEIDPSMGDASHQLKLNNIHGSKEKPSPTDVFLRC